MAEEKLTVDGMLEDIGKLLERVFMERRVGADLGFDVAVIDKYIVDEGLRQQERFDKMSRDELCAMMVDELMSYAE